MSFIRYKDSGRGDTLIRWFLTGIL